MKRYGLDHRHNIGYRQQGFTLLELMIVVAVIAVLAAFAYPAYQRYAMKGWRAEGRMALHELLLQQETYMNQTGTYKEFDAGDTTKSGPLRTFSGDNIANPAYLLGARQCGGGKTLRECVVVFAQPSTSKQDSVITELRLSTAGEKSCTSTDQSVCWP